MMTFDDFWKIYPRRVAKRAAQKAWDKEIKAGTDPSVIISGLRAQLPVFARKDEQFIPHASTWIHQGRFEDEVKLPSRTGRISNDMADFTAELMDRYHEHTSHLSSNSH